MSALKQTTLTPQSPTSARDPRITVARTVDEVESLRPHFERQPSPNLDSDLDYFLTVVRHLPSVVRPHVVLLELSDGREIRVVARLSEQRSRRGRGRPVRTLHVSFGGVIGAETVSDCALAMRVLEATLVRDGADVILLPQLEIGSDMYIAARAFPWWRVDHLQRHTLHWSTELPDSYDAFLKSISSNLRSNARRYDKRVVKQLGDSLVIQRFQDPEHVDQLCADIEVIASRTYQRGLGVGYSGRPLELALIKLAASRGSLRNWVLYIAGVPAAFWLGYAYRGTYWSIATGFDTTYSDLRIGQFLQMRAIADLCAEPGMVGFDWGAGDAEYKRRFGDHCVAKADVFVAASSPHAVRINATRTAKLALARVARECVSRTSIGARAKRMWRANAEQRARRRIEPSSEPLTRRR